MSQETGGPEELIGQELGGYRLMRIIGDGAIGVVYEGVRVAQEPTLPERAAIKVLSVPWQLRGPQRDEFRARFLREGEALRRLQHPNIVRLYAIGETPRPYMALEYVPGGTLEDHRQAEVASGRPFPDQEASRILQQLASALDFAHSQKIIHRDVKPTNVLLDEQGNARLSDFSVAHLLNEATAHLTRTGNQIGTRGYMAPEQARGERNVGPAADIYSLGALVYQTLTGQTPSDQPNQRTRAPQALRPDLPAAAADAILKAMAERPSDRFLSAGAFARAFAAGLEGRYVEGNAPDILASEATRYGSDVPTTIGTNAPQPYAPVALRSRVNPWLAAIAALALVGVFAAVLTNLRLPTGGGSTDKGLGDLPTATPYPPTITTCAGCPTPTPYPTPTTSNSGAGGGGGSGNPTATPTSIPPTPTNTPLPTYVISASAGQSTDGQSHGSGNPYYIPYGYSFPGNLTIMAGAYATVGAWNGSSGGILQFSALGTVEVDGTLSVNGLGYRGGPPGATGGGGGYQGESYLGVGSLSSSSNLGGGGGGNGADGGGGGGGYGTDGQGSNNVINNGLGAPYGGGATYGDSNLTTLYRGSGGGSSGLQNASGAGGNGGGVINISAQTIIVTGSISANGANGLSQPNTAGNYRGGGGGSGGSIHLRAANVTLGNNRVVAQGGQGGYGIWDNKVLISGGNGGVGRIFVEYTESVSGSTNPTAHVAHV